jgi:hypothetical protein
MDNGDDDVRVIARLENSEDKIVERGEEIPVPIAPVTTSHSFIFSWYSKILCDCAVPIVQADSNVGILFIQNSVESRGEPYVNSDPRSGAVSRAGLALASHR